MPFIGTTPTQGFVSAVTKQSFTPNGSTTAFTLSHSVSNENDLEVFVGNVRQEPTTAYTAAGITLTMSEAPATGLNFYVIFKNKAQVTTTPPDGSVSSTKMASGAALANIGSGTITDAKLNSSLDLSSKTLTMPQKFNGLQHITTVNPVGTNAFVQDLSSYEQVMVFCNNVEVVLVVQILK